MTAWEAIKLKLAGVKTRFLAHADPATGDLNLSINLKLVRRAGKEGGADAAMGDRPAGGGYFRP
ncbi:MAG TPA: hypothetical protein PLZ73_11515 [bacterium]|nr:hypothetical protein [bacterium]